jgi:hypothetical protein
MVQKKWKPIAKMILMGFEVDDEVFLQFAVSNRE